MRTYHLEPVVRGDTYPEWTLSADINQIPVEMQRVQASVLNAGGELVYRWDSEGDSANVTLIDGLATFHAIPAAETALFPVGVHNHQVRITYGGQAFTYFRGNWTVQESVNA